MSSVLNLDNIDFDLNTLFNFQTSYDVLKRLIEALAKMQKSNENRISNLEDALVLKTKEVEMMQSTNPLLSNRAKLSVNRNYKGGQMTDEDNTHGSPRHKYDENGNRLYGPDDNSMMDELGNYHNIGNESQMSKKSSVFMNQTQKDLETQDIMNKLNKRVMKLEKEIIEVNKINADLSEFKSKVSKNETEISSNSLNVKDLKTKLDELLTKTDSWSDNIEKLNVKVMDFNIYDLFKNNQVEGGSVDGAAILVQNLESKITQKISFIDKKFKVMEEENYKTKNEVSNSTNLVQTVSKSYKDFKEESDKLHLKQNDSLNELKSSLSNIEQNQLDNIAGLKKIFESNIKELKEMIKEKDDLLKQTEENFNNELNKTKQITSGPGISEADMKMMKDMSKKIHELEKTHKLFVTTVNIDYVKSELNKLNDMIDNKVNSGEFHDLKETVNSMNYQINYTKDTLSQVLEDRKVINDVNWIRKKVESLASSMLTMKNVDDTSASLAAHNKQIPLDSSKYLEQMIFTEFQKGYNRELDGLRKDIDEIKRLIDDVVVALKPKASDKDLKNLEEYLVTKLEELRLNSNKKFADKVETQKNVKYIDAQVKHIIDVYIKKMEKGDNWLIAKKPVNGFACASCESYIGDLQDKTSDYLPWNKYPIRDPNEKAYRVSNINLIKLFLIFFNFVHLK
jgi:hypothetical protein